MAIDSGFNSLEESMNILGVPVMTKSLFVHMEEVTGKWW